MSLAFCSAQNSSQGPQPPLTRFGRSVAYSVDYVRRLSSGNTALLLEFPFAAGPSHRVESAQLNAITSLATLSVTPSLRAQFVSPRLHRQDYPWASDMDSTREVAYCKTELLTRRFTGTWRQRNSGGIDVRTRLKLLFPIGFRGEFRDLYTLGNPCFGSALRTA